MTLRKRVRPKEKGASHLIYAITQARPLFPNFVRLFTLPEWVQNLIEQGWLTPSHGKYILQLVRHDEIFGQLYIEWNHAYNDGQEAPSVHQVRSDILQAYGNHFPWLNGYVVHVDNIKDRPDELVTVRDQSRFGPDCRECSKTHKVSLTEDNVSTFCMDLECALSKAKVSKTEASAFDLDRDYDAELEAETNVSTTTENTQYKQRPGIGDRVFMPLRPFGSMIARHINGNRIGTVIEFDNNKPISVIVRYDATTKACITEAEERWEWLRPATPDDLTDPRIQQENETSKDKARQIAEEQQKRREQSAARRQKLADAVSAGGPDVQLAIVIMHFLNDTDDHDPEPLSTWMKVIMPGSKEKNLAEAAVMAADNLYFDEDAHGLLDYFGIKDAPSNSKQLDAFNS